MEQVNNNNIEEKLSTLNSQLSTNIYPIFDRMMTREDKERLLKQRSVMVWFTGLSGSGKSTVAIALERELHKCGLLCRILDGLYAKARRGEIKDFTGVSAPFEAPGHPDLTLDTSVLSLEESVHKLMDLIIPKVTVARQS